MNIFAFYPGMMSADSVWQLAEASGEAVFTNWHPPVMAILWSWIIILTGNPGLLLVLQVLVLWCGLILFALFVYGWKKSFVYALGVYLIGLAPTTVAISGSLWKDVHMAFSLLFTTILVVIASYTNGKKHRFTLLFAAYIFLAYALNLRHNSIFALIPIFWVVANTVFPSFRLYKTAGVVFMMIFIAITGMTLVNKIYGVVDIHPEVGVMLDDIVHVSKPSDADSTLAIKDVVDNIKDVCAEKDSVMNSVWECTTPEQWVRLTQADNDKVEQLWIQTVTSNPTDYIGYRLSAFQTFLYSPIEKIYLWNDSVDTSPFMAEKGQPNWLTNDLKRYVYAVAHRAGYLFTPLFWLVCSFVAFALAHFFVKERRIYRIACALSVSSVIYIFGYMPVVLAVDYRYVYWPALAIPFVTLLLVYDGVPVRIYMLIERQLIATWRHLSKS